MLVSCGNNVVLKNNQLENASNLTATQMAAYQKVGVVIKGTNSQLQYNGQTYTISPYSSKSCQNFLATLAMGVQVQVIFTGGVNGNQVVIETIQRQQ